VSQNYDSAMEQFREAMRTRGLIPPADLVADGSLHRCDVDGRGGENDGAYVLHMDETPAGGFENHKDGQGWERWHLNLGRNLSPSEKAAFRASMEATRKAHETADRKRRERARETAKRVWASSNPCTVHPYLSRKGIKPFSVRLVSEGPQMGELVIRLVDTSGEIHSLQFIDDAGNKRFLPGGQKKGCYCSMGTPSDAIYIAEGFATASSIFEATGKATASAFDAGNLKAVAEALRAKFPRIDLIICADDDWQTDGNPGYTKAMEAAASVGGKVVVPQFGDSRSLKETDFNDLHLVRGLDFVRACIESQLATLGDSPNPVAAPANEASEDIPLEWPELMSLTASLDAQPYPLEALPTTIREAVDEVHRFVKAPLPLVSSSALAALSLAVQALWDIKRAEKLVGPSGIYLMSIAASGERKSTCDGFFTRSIKEYQTQQAEAAKPLQRDYEADMAAWEAVQSGIKTALSAAAKAGQDTKGLEQAMRDHERRKPVRPRVPRLIYADATPEALKWCLAKEWPSGGVISSEAGIVFGAHGMGKDSVMRNLGTLNQLWDGGEIATERRSTESFTVKGSRLTIALQVQEPTLRAFFSQTGTLARGTGFLARFLLAWPESTQGTRFFTEAPEHWPHLAAFNSRIESLLAIPVPIDEGGALSPAQLTLSTEAKEAWISFHDQIEGQLRDGGHLYEIRDVASKIADNAVRIAALFHVFETPDSSVVNAAVFNAARQVVAWHLNEAQRFFGELALPPGLAEASRLEAWVVNRCRGYGTGELPIAEVQQFGPSGLREKAAIESAVGALQERGRIQMVKRGKRKFIVVNPALLANAKPANPANPLSTDTTATSNISNISISDFNSHQRPQSDLPMASGDD